MLKQLAEKPYAEKVLAVPSLGELYLTTALSYQDEEKNYAFHISQKTDAGKTVIVIRSNLEGSKESVVSRQCSIDEAVEYIDLYVMSILLKKYGEL